MKTGKVYLVGAGPGDPGLFTLRGKQLLEQAEVLVYDRLAGPELMAWVPEACERIYVGKESSNHTLTQEGINELLVAKALEGKQVVRLKGGDPYVFGRGGEEGLRLAEAGVPFEVVSGVTSAIAGLAAAGIPITHRGIATSFHVFTAHLKEEGGRLDWPVIAQLEGTLVFLMGRANLPQITQELMRYGKRPETPCGVVQWGSLPWQRTVTGTLADIEGRVEAESIGSPCLIAVGDVVALRPQLGVFEARPLFGKKVVITRARLQSSRFREMLTAQGAQVVELPAIRIEPLPAPELNSALEGLGRFTWLAFTSVNGVELFFKRLFDSGLDLRALGHLKLAVIGDGTAERLKAYGLNADVVPERFVAESMAEALEPLLNENDVILLPRAREARPVLVERLRERCEVCEIPVYQTLEETADPEVLEELMGSPADAVTFASSSTVRHFVRMMGAERIKAMKQTRFISIGPVTTGTMKELGLPVHREAAVHNLDGLLEAVEAVLKEEC